MIKTVYWPSYKVPVFSRQILIKREFSIDRFWKNSQISNFIKIRLVEAELFHKSRRTDMTKLVVVLRNFANTLKNPLRFQNVWKCCWKKTFWCNMFSFKEYFIFWRVIKIRLSSGSSPGLKAREILVCSVLPFLHIIAFSGIIRVSVRWISTFRRNILLLSTRMMVGWACFSETSVHTYQTRYLTQKSTVCSMNLQCRKTLNFT